MGTKQQYAGARVPAARGRRLATAAGIGFGALLLLAGCSGGSANTDAAPEGAEQSLVTVRLAENNTSASLAAYIADQQGFFEDHGIKIEATVLADISKIPPALGQQFDIGFGVQPALIRAASSGLDVVVASGNGLTSSERPEILLVTKPDSGIEGAADLAGKTLAAPTLNGNLHLGTLYWLDQNGVDPAAVNQVQVPTPSMIDQLEQGVIDVAELQEPYITVAKGKGLTVLPYGLSAVADPTSMSVWISSGEWANANEETIMSFRAAIDDAYTWMTENEAEAKAMLAEFTQQDIALVNNAPLPVFSSKYAISDLEAWDRVLRTVTDFSADVDLGKLVAFPSAG